MGRLLVVAIALGGLLSTGRVCAQFSSNADLRIGVEIAAGHTDALPSWLDGSVGKQLHQDTQLTIRGYTEYAQRLTDTLSGNLALEVTGDQQGDPIHATEAYLQWRPIPRSTTRYQIRLGAFYPRLSLENTLPGWRSPYTSSYSAINTWIAEELRATGLELTASRKLQGLGPNHRLILQGSVFGWNDPAGSLLAWRGWALHERKSRFGDNLPLQPLPLNQPDQMFNAQASVVEPFKEVDNRPGVYGGAEWQVRGKISLKGLYYDNRADPEALESGQYAWDTRFLSVGLKLSLSAKTTLLTQWVGGNTAMGPLMSGRHVVDADFDSYYVLLSKKLRKHRFTTRYDHFQVTDRDVITQDDNNESGSGWTLSHRYQWSDQLSVSTEWNQVKTHRPGWAFNGFNTTESENQFQIQLRYVH